MDFLSKITNPFKGIKETKIVEKSPLDEVRDLITETKDILDPNLTDKERNLLFLEKVDKWQKNTGKKVIDIRVLAAGLDIEDDD